MPDQGTYPLTFPVTSSPLPKSARLGLAAALAGASLMLAAVALSAFGADQPRQDSTPELSLSATEPFGQPVSEPDVLVSETSSIAVEAPSVSEGASAEAQDFTLPPPAVTTSQSSAVAVVAAPPPPAPAVAAAPAAAPATLGARWLSEGFVFVLEGQAWDAESIANVDAALSKLPASIRARLANRALGPLNILVNRDGRSLSGKQPYGGPANYFSTNDGVNELVLFPGQSVQTILHELGHAFNLRRTAAGRYATVLLDAEMQSFMAATGWRLLSTPEQVRAARDHMQVQVSYDGPHIWPRLSNDDPLEDFANSFALYFLAPDDLRTRSAERFAWFEANVGR